MTARKLGLNKQKGRLSDDELIRLMIEEPNLIRRPFFVINDEIVSGFDKSAKAQLSARLGKPLG